MKSVFVSLLNFNGRKNTLECLESLKKINLADIKLTVLIVDNNSTEPLDLKDDVQGEIKIKVIKNKNNLGFSGGNNVGIRYALKNNADYILLLNNDTYVDPNFLTELLKTAEKDKSFGILVPKIYFAPGFEFHKDRYAKEQLGKVFWYAGGKMDWNNVIGSNRGVDEVDKGQFDKTEETEIATGCCMLISREVSEKIGYFDEEYFLYYEDADLTIRAKNNGFKIMYVPGSIIWHKNAGSVGGSGSVLQDYYITRNRLLFGFRYAPARSKLALFRESLALLFKGRQWQKRGVIDFYLEKFGKGSYKDE
jgi:GT2 family glycosyltransferase